MREAQQIHVIHMIIIINPHPPGKGLPGVGFAMDRCHQPITEIGLDPTIVSPTAILKTLHVALLRNQKIVSRSILHG